MHFGRAKKLSRMRDAETGGLVSRLDAFMPVNCFVGLAACRT